MYTELPYRLALVIIAALQLAISFGYLMRCKAKSTVKGPRAEGPILAWGAGLSLIAFCMGSLIWLINPLWMTWGAVPLPASLRWLGAPLMALGAALHLWGTLHLGRNFTVTVSTVQCPTLVTSGPFRWVRHPLYSGGMLESLGVVFLVANWAVAAATVAFWSVVVIRTAKEEAALVKTFGDDYRDYQRRVGRFLPRVFTRGPATSV